MDLRKTILKDENMSQVIVNDRDTALMNYVATMFPTSFILLCKYHITKNVRSRVKPAVGTKQIKLEDGKMVKYGVVVENIMDAWTDIINSSIEELYVECVVHFGSVCVTLNFVNLLGDVENALIVNEN